MSDRRRRSRSAPASAGHDVHSQRLESHDSPPLSPSLTFGWVQLTRMSSRCSVQNAGNSESGSTSASVSARGPLAAVTMCWAGLSIKHFDTKKKINNGRGNASPSDMRTNELPAISGKVEHVLLSSASGCCILFDFLLLG